MGYYQHGSLLMEHCVVWSGQEKEAVKAARAAAKADKAAAKEAAAARKAQKAAAMTQQVKAAILPVLRVGLCCVLEPHAGLTAERGLLFAGGAEADSPG